MSHQNRMKRGGRRGGAASRYRCRGKVDRSRADLAVISQMARSGWTNDQILAAFAEPTGVLGSSFENWLGSEGIVRLAVISPEQLRRPVRTSHAMTFSHTSRDGRHWRDLVLVTRMCGFREGKVDRAREGGLHLERVAEWLLI